MSLSESKHPLSAAIAAALLSATGMVMAATPPAADAPLLEPAASAEDRALRAAVATAAKTGRLRLRLPDGKALDVAVSSELRDGFLHLRGRGTHRGIHLVQAGRSLHGTITSGGKEFRVVQHRGQSALSPVSPNALPQLDDAIPTPFAPADPATPAGVQRNGATVRSAIDVLAFLDPLVAAELGANGARASWLLNVEVSNAAMANSLIPDARFQTVGFVDFPTSLTRLRDKLFAFQPDPAANERRNAFGADFAALYAPALEGDTICGIAYLFGLTLNADGSFAPFSNVDDFSAFSVNGTTEALAGGFGCGLLTVPHEFGHNLAANHNLGNGGGQPFPYSVGDRCGTLNTADIMSNRAFGIFDDDATLIFSTPRVSVEGQPCGIADVVDNARAIDQVFDFASAYRSPPAVAGTLSLTPLTATVSEADDELRVTLNRDGDLGVAASVELAAIGDPRAARIAAEGEDFVETVTRVEFPIGAASVDVRVPLIESAGDRGTRNLLVVPRYPIGLAVPSDLMAEIAITDTTAPPVISVDEPAITAVENAGSARFRLTRSNSLLDSVSVDFTIGGGTATAGVDYVAASGTVTWPAGDGAARDVVVTLLDDAVFERIPDGETVNLTLSNPQGGATLGAVSTGVLTITDNEVAIPGQLSFSAASYTVAEAGGSATITVSRVGGTDGAVEVGYAASAGTATAGSDFMATTGTLSWPDRDGAPRTFTVAISDDNRLDPAETVLLNLSSPTGGAALGSNASAVLTIADNEVPVPGALSFGAASYAVDEGGGTATVTVIRSGGADGAISVGYAGVDGTATAGTDYTAAAGTLNWADLDSAPKSFTVAIADDSGDEPAETVSLRLAAPTGGATLGSVPSATLTIADNDEPPASGGGSASPLLMLLVLAAARLRRHRRAA